ncbi:hypothetical protein [Amycolatopsis aidingensis]|uniref:hypothetical protein n=1 Tax=Amycolatopsis aidingensis TaxID=2842453 RepID=UPI001C0E75FA|nr:hypothetical protein [Amycolatopsis aidingensis]
MPGRAAFLPLVAALILVSHLLGPHTHGHAAYLAAPVDHHHSETHDGRPSDGHNPAGDGPCGYPCARDGGSDPAGSVHAWPEAVPVPEPPPVATRPAHANGARGPPDLVRELQVMRV